MTKEYLKKSIIWTKTDDQDFPYAAKVDNESWKLRLNDFPEEPLYTLCIEGRPAIDFDDWPESWTRP